MKKQALVLVLAPGLLALTLAATSACTQQPAVEGDGASSQPQASKPKEAICVRQLLEVLSRLVNQKVQSSVGSRFIAA